MARSIAIALVAVTGVSGIWTALRSEPRARSPREVSTVARPLSPTLSVATRDGEVHLGAAGTPTIAFLIRWDCPPCIDELDELERRLPLDEGPHFVVVTLEGGDDALGERWPALAASGRVTPASAHRNAAEAFFGTLSTPAIAVLDGRGKVVRRFLGRTGIDELLETLAQADSQSPQDPSHSLQEVS